MADASLTLQANIRKYERDYGLDALRKSLRRALRLADEKARLRDEKAAREPAKEWLHP